MKTWLCAVTAVVSMMFTLSGLEEARAETIDIPLPVSIYQQTKPQISDGVLYYIGMDLTLYALDLQGKEKWKRESLKGDRFSPLTVDANGDVCLVSSSYGELILFCVGHNNSDLLTVSLGGGDGGTPRAPVIGNEAVLVLSEGQLFSVNKKTESVSKVDSFPWRYTITEGKNQSSVGMLVGRDRIKLFLNENADSTGSVLPPTNFGLDTEPNISPPSAVQIDH